MSLLYPVRLADALKRFPTIRRDTGSKDLEDVLRSILEGDVYQDIELQNQAFRSDWLDDFIGGGIDSRFSSTAGGGAGAAAATTVANGLNGEITIKSSSANAANSANAATLTLDDLGYKANQGFPMIEARVKIDSLTSAYIFVGFTDTISTTVECPIGITGTTPNSDATDAAGFVFDASATNLFWHLGGVKADVDATPVNSQVAPATTYQTIRVFLDTNGKAYGQINNGNVLELPNALTASVALTPAVFVSNRAAAQRTLTIDYVRLMQNR